jgi:hypothetical protein
MRRLAPKDDRMEVAVALLEKPLGSRIDRSEWQPSELRRVVVRLAGGELVQVGTAPNRESAMTLARNVIREIRQPSGEWPLVNDRHLDAETVVSIDVLRI